MNRRELTLAVARQILFMEDILRPLGMAPRLDWYLRSLEDQRALFLKGLSKCDGVEKVSAHQVGLAADIYAIGPGPNGRPMIVDVLKTIPGPWETIRNHWLKLGGKTMIEWDPCHFEG